MCMPLRSNVNLSRIIRTTSCFGISRLIACGRPKIDSKISRDATSQVQVELHRSLLPVLEKMKLDQFQLVGLEQTTGSQSLYSFAFPRRTAAVAGPCGGNSDVRLAAQFECGHSHGHGDLRILSPVPEGLKLFFRILDGGGVFLDRRRVTGAMGCLVDGSLQ